MKSRNRGPIAAFPGDQADPGGFARRATDWAEHLLVTGRTPATVATYTKDFSYFLAWCGDRGLRRPGDVTRPVLERYQRHLFHYRKSNGRPLSLSAQQQRLVVIQAFYRWTVRQYLLPANPAADLELPRFARGLPRDVMSESEVESVLAQPDISEPDGLRDRAMLETLYSTGVRRLELSRLGLFDVDRDRGAAVIRQGKGRKDRVVPVGERALAWIEKYVADVRPQLVYPPDPGNLFLSLHGEPVHPDTLSTLAREYIVAAGVRKMGACHLFRHTMATLMLENGADIRFIQQMLGHSSLETTHVYTRVSVKKLAEIHAATHPGARLERRAAIEKTSDVEPARSDVAALKAELAAALADEALDESRAKGTQL